VENFEQIAAKILEAFGSAGPPGSPTPGSSGSE
jgi:hypothetical protein